MSSKRRWGTLRRLLQGVRRSHTRRTCSSSNYSVRSVQRGLAPFSNAFHSCCCKPKKWHCRGRRIVSLQPALMPIEQYPLGSQEKSRWSHPIGLRRFRDCCLGPWEPQQRRPRLKWSKGSMMTRIIPMLAKRLRQSSKTTFILSREQRSQFLQWLLTFC